METPKLETISVYFPHAEDGEKLTAGNVGFYREMFVNIEVPAGFTACGVRGDVVNGKGLGRIIVRPIGDEMMHKKETQ